VPLPMALDCLCVLTCTWELLVYWLGDAVESWKLWILLLSLCYDSVSAVDSKLFASGTWSTFNAY
jgi:hypothetical protein